MGIEHFLAGRKTYDAEISSGFVVKSAMINDVPAIYVITVAIGDYSSMTEHRDVLPFLGGRNS